MSTYAGYVLLVVLQDIWFSLSQVIPGVFKTVAPFVLFVVVLRVGYWLRKKYKKGLRG